MAAKIVALLFGCRDGLLSRPCRRRSASLLHVASITGSDVDRNLIKDAQSHLAFQWSRTKPEGRAAPTSDALQYFPVSSVLDHGHRALPPTPNPESDEAAFPNNVHFICEDWVLSPVTRKGYDVILALSVVKWIHLHHLDGGLRAFFHKCKESLTHDGYLVLEIQPWKSYETAITPKKAPQLASNFSKLELRPEDFEGLLREEGFVCVASSTELPRDICIYQKVRRS